MKPKIKISFTIIYYSKIIDNLSINTLQKQIILNYYQKKPMKIKKIIIDKISIFIDFQKNKIVDCLNNHTF